MGEIKVKISDRVEMDFRKTALTAFGYHKGAISKAAEQALASWADEKKHKPAKSHTRPVKLECDFTVGDEVIDRILDRIESQAI